MRLEVRLQREIARLHFYDTASSSRAIASATGVSPGTVGSLRELLRNQPKNWEALKDLDDDAWRDALGTHDRTITVSKPAPDWAWVHEQMQRADATLGAIWLEWRENNPDGIGHTQFTTGYRQYTKKQHITMRRLHLPGEKLFVDFAGRVVPIVDSTGKVACHAQVFVAVLGYSNYTFVCAVPTQTTADWVTCHVRCFEFLGGAPEWVVCDNLKAAVIRRERDRIVINATYLECLKHYDTAPAPTRARKPKDKGKAEVGVQIVQRLMFRMRDRVFSSIEELNEALGELTDKLNGHQLKKLKVSRRDRFEQAERAALKPLPNKPFELCEWRHQVLVGQDYHVEHAGGYYSVPCELLGRRVDLRVTASMVEIFHSNRRVALHARLFEPGAMSTLAEHRPVSHLRVLEGEPKQLAQWADSVGEKAKEMILHHLTDRRDRANGLRAARRMRELAREYSEARFEQVCAYALKAKIHALDKVESIFKKKPDLQPPRNGKPPVRTTHENVRGPQYFGA
ncbi:MAG TPA: IS21 family transposase [Vicinamibacterales bacterium]|nr:IS21 family transposase [Vicinamibacterales bacterium]